MSDLQDLDSDKQSQIATEASLGLTEDQCAAQVGITGEIYDWSHIACTSMINFIYCCSSNVEVNGSRTSARRDRVIND